MTLLSFLSSFFLLSGIVWIVLQSYIISRLHPLDEDGSLTFLHLLCIVISFFIFITNIRIFVLLNVLS